MQERLLEAICSLVKAVVMTNGQVNVVEIVFVVVMRNTCLLSRKISLKSSSLPALTSAPTLEISLITISTWVVLAIMSEDSLSKELVVVRV